MNNCIDIPKVTRVIYAFVPAFVLLKLTFFVGYEHKYKVYTSQSTHHVGLRVQYVVTTLTPKSRRNQCRGGTGVS